MPSGRGARAPVYLLLFGILVAFYAATFSSRNITDTDLNSLQTRALALHGDVDLSRYRSQLDPFALWTTWHGKRYSIYGVGVSLPAVPLYAVMARLDASEPALQAAAAIPFVAAAVLVMFRLLLRMTSRALAVAATVVLAFGTTMWPVAAMAFYQNGSTALFQALGLTGFFSRKPRAPALAGFGFAAATFVRPLVGIALAFVGGFYLLRDRRALGWYVAGAAVPIAGIVVQNRWLWGGWLTGGYSHNVAGFRGDVPEALWGLLFGWWRGLLVYSPVLALGFVGWFLALRRFRGFVEERMIVLGAISVATVLLYARFTTWYGGLSQFGYRYLLDAVPFLVLLGVFAVDRRPALRPWALLSGALSVMTMAFGAAPNEFGWDGTLFATDPIDTSLGQAWLVAVNHPGGAVLRLAGVAVIGWLLHRSAGRARPTEAVP